MKFKIAILCAARDSSYFDIPSDIYELDIYTIQRPLKYFSDSIPVIAHPPCAQWSRLHKSANYNAAEKQLAFDCFHLVRKNGGILEHPHGSHFMREVIGYDNCQQVNQSWFGFKARKSTLLYMNKVKLLGAQLSSELPSTTVTEMLSDERARSTIQFNKWLCDSVYNSFCIPILSH